MHVIAIAPRDVIAIGGNPEGVARLRLLWNVDRGCLTHNATTPFLDRACLPGGLKSIQVIVLMDSFRRFPSASHPQRFPIHPPTLLFLSRQ
jgi:hypothetical protein